MLSHHRHQKSLEPLAFIETVDSVVTPSSNIVPESLNMLSALFRRSTCGPNDNTPECEKPVRSNGLAIGLGVGIPFLLALTVLVIIHFRHLRKLKKEEEEDKDFDLDNDDPYIGDGVRAKPSAYTLNGNGEKVPVAFSEVDMVSMKGSTVVLEDPFNNSPYKIPELTSSQRSLNNFDMYDLGAYPPSGPIYDHPKYPGSAYTRSSSPVSVSSNPYAQSVESHQIYGGINPSHQALNPSSHSLQKSYPKLPSSPAPYMNPSRVSSALSVVSSHTPTVQTSASHAPVANPTSATLGHSESESISSTRSAIYSSGAQQTDVTIPDVDDDESRMNRIEQKLDREIQVLEAETNSVKSEDKTKHARGLSQFSFTEGEQFNSAPGVEVHEKSSAPAPTNDLSRAVTKGTAEFAPVKAVYNEYFPSEMKSPEMETHNFTSVQAASKETDKTDSELPRSEATTTQAQSPKASDEQSQVNQDKRHSSVKAENSSQYDQNDQYDEQDHGSHHDQYDQYAQNHQYDQQAQYVQHNQYDQYNQQGQYEQHGQYGQYEQYEQYEQYGQYDQNGQYDQQSQYSQYYDQNGQHGYDASHQSSQYTGHASPSSHMSRPSDRHASSNGERYVMSPKPATPIRPAEPLTKLPTPHQLGETGSSISYAPKRRNPSTPSSPKLAYNPIANSTWHDEKPLPSPSQLGSSSSVFSSTGFMPPKKFTGSGGNRSRSNSFADPDGGYSIKSGSTTPRGGYRPRPPSELVPDVASQLEKLKPRMDMR